MKIAGTPIRTFEGYLLALMVLVDLLFLALSLTHHYGSLLDDRRYSINGHGGFGEFWQYLKESCCFLMLTNAAIRCRQPLLLAWAALFLYLLLTDVFRINTLIGTWLSHSPLFDANGLNVSRWYLKRAVIAMCGSVLLITLAICHWRSRQKSLREDSAGLCRLLFLYLLFGIAVDFLNRALAQAGMTFFNLASVIEEWGEMLVMSLLVLGTYLTFVRALRSNAQHQSDQSDRARLIAQTHEPDSVFEKTTGF